MGSAARNETEITMSRLREINGTFGGLAVGAGAARSLAFQGFRGLEGTTVMLAMALVRKMPNPSFSISPKGPCFRLHPGFPGLRYTTCWRA